VKLIKKKQLKIIYIKNIYQYFEGIV